MESGPRRYQVLAALFGGAFGNELFENWILLGVADNVPSRMDAYLALYIAGSDAYDCPWVEVAKTELSRATATAQLLGLNMTKRQRAQQAVQVAYVADEDMAAAEDTAAAVERVAVQMASAALRGLELPIAFVTWLTPLEGGPRQVVYWHVARAPGDVLLELLKRVAAA